MDEETRALCMTGAGYIAGLADRWDETQQDSDWQYGFMQGVKHRAKQSPLVGLPFPQPPTLSELLLNPWEQYSSLFNKDLTPRQQPRVYIHSHAIRRFKI